MRHMKQPATPATVAVRTSMYPKASGDRSAPSVTRLTSSRALGPATLMLV